MSGAPVVSVSGGVGGIHARIDDLLITAAAFRTAGAATEHEARVLRWLGSTALSGLIIDPAGAERAREALWFAVEAPGGAGWIADECALVEQTLRQAAARYLESDVLGSPFAALTHFVRAVPHTVERFDSDLLGGDPLDALQALVSGDPQLASEVLSVVPGLEPLATLGLSAVNPDGHPVVTSLGVDSGAATPPRSLADILRGLDRRNDGHDGEIDIRILSGTDGSGRPYRKVIVDIPGTKSFSPIPGAHTDVADLGTNYGAIEGRPTTYEQGVITALRQAGVGPDDEVMLVGHSLGGAIAVNTARDLTASGEFHVTRVVTAGAPVGIDLKSLPSSVQVLAIENKSDLVPQLDGATNPDAPNITTVTVDSYYDGIAANHSLADSYIPGAIAIATDGSPSVTGFLDGLDGFTSATDVTTHAYVVTRGFW